jgi:hypothetical protein
MKHKSFFPIIAGAVVCLGLATTQLRAEPGVEEIPVPGETVGSEEGGVILPDVNDGGVITVEGGGEITVGGDEGGGPIVDSDPGGEVTITPAEEGGETTVTVNGEEGTVVANDDATGTPGSPEGTVGDPGIYSPLAENNSPTSQTVNSIQSSAATDTNNWDAATIHSAKEADGYSVEDNSKQTVLKATRQNGRVFLKAQP